MTGQVKQRVRMTTDWWRILVDLQYAGVTHASVCRAIDVPRSTLTGWKNGSDPSHDDGYELIEMWIAVTGKPFADRPMRQKTGFRTPRRDTLNP